MMSCAAWHRRVTKKKDLFDPTNDKWVHDRFDLPPEQDVDHDSVRGRCSPLHHAYPVLGRHQTLRASRTCSTFRSLKTQHRSGAGRSTIYATGHTQSNSSGPCTQCGFGCRRRAFPVVEVGAAVVAAGRRAGAAGGAGAAFRTRMATHPLGMLAATWRAAAAPLVQRRRTSIPSVVATGMQARSNGRRQAKPLGTGLR